MKGGSGVSVFDEARVMSPAEAEAALDAQCLDELNRPEFSGCSAQNLERAGRSHRDRGIKPDVRYGLAKG